MNEAKRDQTTHVSAWYSVQMLTIVFNPSWGVRHWNTASLRSQYDFKSANARSTFDEFEYLALISLPWARVPTPNRNTRRTSWPGSTLSRLCKAPQWLPPSSTLPWQWPRSTAIGLVSVR